MIYDIVTNEKDLDHCVKAQRNVYIFLKLCVDVEEQLGYWVFGMSVVEYPIRYREP